MPKSLSPPISYQKTLTEGSNFSTAQAGYGDHFDPSIAAGALAAGTGVLQSAPEVCTLRPCSRWTSNRAF